MKVALLCYHKNLTTLYKYEWIEKYHSSISNQSFEGFEIFELNYGGGPIRIFGQSHFESFPYPTFAHSLNYLLDQVFASGYDVAFNSNVDDWYDTMWMERLLANVVSGHDLVSSNFCLVKEGQITEYHTFHGLNISQELANGHNIICHPAVAYTKKFWQQNRYIPGEMPLEDLKLWQRAITKGMSFYINDNNLLYHRIHDQSVCNSENK